LTPVGQKEGKEEGEGKREGEGKVMGRRWERERGT